MGSNPIRPTSSLKTKKEVEMKLAKIKVIKQQHGIELKAYCPNCNGIIPVPLDMNRVKPVARDYQTSVILTGRCAKCHSSFHAVIRIN